MNSIERGFTLIELLVVVAIISILSAAIVMSVGGARERARIQKATSEVKIISQAILARENYDRGGGKFELPTMNDRDADASALSFLLGEENAKSGGNIPVLLQAALASGRTTVDPWGTPYKLKIVEASVAPSSASKLKSMQTGFYLPNFYRLSEGER